jgi:decaprenylphospho-beta-D-erythro-pentofuranosid-2-ulose 2-reductase
MTKVLIIGATSAIAEATARLFALRLASLYLVARNEQRVAAIASDLRIRGATQVAYEVLDLNDFAAHAAMLDRANQALGGFDVVLIAHGTLDDQRLCEDSVDLTMRALSTNGLSIIALCTQIAPRLCAQGGGTLAVLSSVAGDRGKRSNYVYGSAKALVSTYLSGLRQRLYSTGVQVLTIKPGLVDTPMTAAFPKGPLWASPRRVATGILRAIDRKLDVAYLPYAWGPAMWLIRLIPETVFKRLKL